VLGLTIPNTGQVPSGTKEITLVSLRTIQLYNRQRSICFDLPWLRRFAPIALAACEGEGIASGAPLESTEELEVSIVSDRAIAAVHRRFMNIAGPTDVITFDHGEIIVSAATAARHAREYGQRIEHELGLYIIHGVLHLNGHDDLVEPAAARMKETQANLLRRVLRRVPL
jgi:probable rRNA maturation factor